jgi:neutral trehalase
MWLMRSRDLDPADPVGRRAAARAHVAEYLDLTATGAVVAPAERGMDSLAYAQHVLSGPLLKPRREEDTELRLRTRYDFIVPGTRFDDPFPADNAIAALGLLAGAKTRPDLIQPALHAIANTEYDTMRFGYAENFSKLAMLRGQTELDSLAMEATRGLYGNAALVHWRDALLRNINFLHEGSGNLDQIPLGSYGAYRRIGQLPSGIRLHRNWDDTPVNYKLRSVIRVESAEKDRETGERSIAGIRDEDERAAKWVHTQKSLGAAAESFEDMADWQLEDWLHLETTQTVDIYTSWRQASVAHKIKLAAEASEILGDYQAAERLWGRFNELKEGVSLMWRQTGPNKGHYTDLLLSGEQTGALNAAQILPLLVGNDFVPYDRATMTINLFREKLLGPYGLHTSDILDCPEQWSGHKDWPSLATLAMHASMEQAREAKRRGQDPEPFLQFAEDVQEALIKGLDAWYAIHGTLPERINGDNPTRIALGGEYCSVDEDGNEPEPQIGFAMTAGALINAKVFNLRGIFEHINPNHSWMSQAFALNLGRMALVT